MVSNTKQITLFKRGLDELIQAVEFRIGWYKSQIAELSDEDKIADLGNDAMVLHSVLELLKATNNEWNNEINNYVKKYKEEQS